MRITNSISAATMLFSTLIAGSAVHPLPASASSAAVPCDGFALGYEAPSKTKNCSTDTVSQGRYTVDRKEMYINGSDYLLELVYDVAAHNVYFPESSTREGFETSFGQLKVTAWGPQTSVGGFQTATFQLLGDPHPGGYCFAFDKYAGTPHGELEGPPGYTRKAYGFYCSVAMADADKRASTIAAALQGLRVPSH